MRLVTNTKITKTDGLFILVPEKNAKKSLGSLVPKATVDEIEKAQKQNFFENKAGAFLRLQSPLKGVPVSFVVGLGKVKTNREYRCAVRGILKKAQGLKLKKISIVLPTEIDFARAAGGAFAGNYQFKIGNTKDLFQVSEVTFITKEKLTSTDIAREKAFGESVELTKDLVNYPPNYIYPATVTKEVKAMAKKIKGLKVTVLGLKQLQKLKMGALLGVAQGSEKEPQVVIIEYAGGKKGEAPVALVGKGVTFDSGGYNLKPTRYIEDMKCDMAGSATVIGLLRYFAAAKVKKNIIGAVGLVENMVSKEAYRPGDVITAMNGKTIEVTNTDAEGRLVLADVLHYVEKKYKPAAMVDFATLTGSCMHALGYTISGIMSKDDALVKAFEKSSEKADEKIWRLPLDDYFIGKTKGSISDLENATDGVLAGASMAAAFLANFVEKTSWAHFDIAGTAFNGKGGSGGPKMATGAIMRTVREWVESGK